MSTKPNVVWNMRLASICVILFSAASAFAQGEPANAVFWKQLESLCGKAFAGRIDADTSNSPDFANKDLVMHVRSCEKNRISIPFFVGDDRHEDGKPDKVTMYGGRSTNTGMATRQFFPADEETVKVVAAPVATHHRRRRIFGGSRSYRANIFRIICGGLVRTGCSA